MKFEYLDTEQRSPDWFKVRMGRITASRLPDWMAVSKAKGKEGEPLKARFDYERELWFERKFGVNFNNYISPAMLDGQLFEEYARQQYQFLKGGVPVERCGCWHNEFFVASPDGIITNEDGLLEIKVVRDNTFTEILLGGVPEKHWTQIQGQLFASGKKFCDYVALNLNTKKMSVWRVEPNLDFYKLIEESIQVPISVEEVATNEIYDIHGELPEAAGLLAFNEEPVWQ